MKRRKSKSVVHYHTSNKIKESEKYFQHLLMLYYPWWNEDTLSGHEQTHASKIYEPEVQAVVEQNKAIFKPDADAVSEVLEAPKNNESNNIVHSFDSFNDQENHDLWLDLQQIDENKEETLNKETPSHLVPKFDSCRALTIPTIHTGKRTLTLLR